MKFNRIESMTNLDVLIAECRKQDEEMQKVTARIGDICDKIREDITECAGPEDCKAEEHVVELPELKKAAL